MKQSTSVRTCVTLAIVCIPAIAYAQKQLRRSAYNDHQQVMAVEIRSPFSSRYLQAHTDGEMHASNTNRKNEETWVLQKVGSTNDGVYALRNGRTGNYLSLREGREDCPVANRANQADWERWEIVRDPNRQSHEVALKNLHRQQYLGTNPPGNDAPGCGGEVFMSASPTWWTMNKAPKEFSGDGINWASIISDVGDIADVIGSFF
jgi:hypothetical protein